MSPRHRLTYCALAALTIGCGLATRPLRGLIGVMPAKYLGDALYAVLVYLVIAAVWRRASSIRVAMVALALCFAVEFSQLYHPEWLDGIRRTTFGILVLGSVFNWPDLIAYAAGVAACFLLECLVRRPSPGTH
jgi:hypothetical protein